uniref:Alkene monooxygenase coupling/effecter protein n=1 Tax=Alteromonadaceae bacterium PE-TB08W TaxID=1199097 RepID=A0A3G9DSK3_9ALTE|nr:alkene monooxygenase coupling/effecter protein [Alteromonadaceae bacterium PE-TB08W]
MNANNKVGISLMKSEETQATLDYLSETAPGVNVSDRDCFYKIEREDKLSFDMDGISDHLGRDLDTDIFLVNMSTYYGRIVVSDGLIEIFSEIEPERFKE